MWLIALWCSLKVAHGNEDTFREIFCIKRSVMASFSQTHFKTTIIDAGVTAASTGKYIGDAAAETKPQ